MSRLLLVLAFALALAPRHAFGADCDSTTITFGYPYDGPVYTFPGTVDSASAVWGPPGSQSTLLAGFDFQQGKLFGTLGACSSFLVQGSDTYRIEPIASTWKTTTAGAIPITITVSGEFVGPPDPGMICKYCPYFTLSVQAASGERDTVGSNGVPTPDHRTARIDLAPQLGEEFKLTYRLYGSDFLCAHGSASVQIGFTGIPPGARLVSVCRGDEPAVDVRRRTWGSLKATYR